jgi:homoaconitase/3-isopropylmalate dehydratase large subunit
VHEVTSPVSTFARHTQKTSITDMHRQQAFEGLEVAGRKVRRPDCTLATTDHVRFTHCSPRK